MQTYGPGTLAYLDTFSGLVPCKVLAVDEQARTCTVRLTATRCAYKRGEVLVRETWLIAACPVPRQQVYTLGGRYRIRGDFAWVAG